MNSVGGPSPIYEHGKTKTSATLIAPDELPRIGAPATRALADIGITRLSQLTEHRAADLLKLHGMGPRAMAILRESLADRGLALRDEEAK
jgi:hypothetical protein